MSTHFLQQLTEDDLWSLANDPNCPVEVREAAMRRWLFPEEYGYSWAEERLNSVREVLRKQRSEIEKIAA